MRLHTSDGTLARNFITPVVIAALMTCLWYVPGASAAIRVWDGSGSRNWSADTNWVGNPNSPTGNDIARFSANYASTRQPRVESLTIANNTVNMIRVTTPNRNVVVDIQSGRTLRLQKHTNNRSIEVLNNRNLTLRSAGTLLQQDVGAVTWRLSGSGNLTISSGIFQLQNDVHLTINVDSGPIVDINTGISSSAAKITKSGAGLLRFDGNNLHSGGTILSAGEIRLGNAGGLGTNSNALTVNGGTLDLQSFTANVGAVIITAGTVEDGTLQGSSYDVRAGTISAALSNEGGGSALTKTTGGTVTLSAANTYAGDTDINAGTLTLTGLGGIASSPVITIASGAFFDVSGVTGGFSLASGQTITGGGTVLGDMTLDNGATIAPGNSPGTTTYTGNQTWVNGVFEFEIDDADGPAGTTWDLDDISGSLDLTGLTSLEIDVISQLTGGGDVLGSLLNFDLFDNYTWTFATADGGITGFDADDFSVDTSLFTNNNFIGNGFFTVEQDGNDLNLVYHQSTIPEPTSLLLAMLGLLSLLGCGRNRRRRSA